LAFDLFERGRLDFDAFRGDYLMSTGAGYAFVEAPDGHLAPVFPIGTALVTLPIYAAFEAGRAGHDAPAIEAPAFEPLRRAYERLAAAIVAALSVALFVLCAREFAGPAATAIAAAAYAFGTAMWSTASQALWQHGPLNAFVLAMTYALFRALRTSERAQTRWLAVAGLCAGLLPVIRPTAALYTLAAAVFVAFTFRARAAWFGAALAAGLAPGVAWNLAVFHTLLGGYAANARAYDLAPGRAAAAFAALLVSPSRGWFVFSPVLLFAPLGAVRAWRSGTPAGRLVAALALAGAAIALQYAFFRYWWGGYAYGPRFLTDLAAVAALCLAYAVPARARTPAAAVFGVALAFSMVVQFAGTASGAAGSDWNAVPVSIDVAPQRVWALADGQIERNVRATYMRYAHWDVARTPDYVGAFHACVSAVRPVAERAPRDATIAATAAVLDDGTVRAYGYDSGVYVGQLRVAVRVVDERGRLVSEQPLYVRGSPKPGESAQAAGLLTLPRTPGAYRLDAVPALLGIDAPGEAGESPPPPRKNRCSAVSKEVVS
jgi:hypothetical protein